MDLHEFASALFKDLLLLFGERRVWIHAGEKVTVLLHQLGGEGTENDIAFETIEDGLIGEKIVVNDLAVLRGFLGDQTFQFDENAGLLEEHLLNLRGGGSNAREISFFEFGEIPAGVVLHLISRTVLGNRVLCIGA